MIKRFETWNDRRKRRKAALHGIEPCGYTTWSDGLIGGEGGNCFRPGCAGHNQNSECLTRDEENEALRKAGLR